MTENNEIVETVRLRIGKNRILNTNPDSPEFCWVQIVNVSIDGKSVVIEKEAFKEPEFMRNA